MLVKVQPEGSKPPLFFVHGVNGVMPIGGSFASVFGPDQPLYIFNAFGFDNGQPPFETVNEMAQAYVAAIADVAPTGPLVIGGMCRGTLLALEVARRLLAKGRTMGPVILADPPHAPQGNEPGVLEPSEPRVARQLYDYTMQVMKTFASYSFHELPFDVKDPQQLHVATKVGVACLVALYQFNPKPFLGAVELIINDKRAGAFFGSNQPNQAWQRILPNPHVAHVLPYGHLELFRSRRFEVARLIKYILDGAFIDARSSVNASLG